MMHARIKKNDQDSDKFKLTRDPCPLCGEMMWSVTQPALMPNRPDRVYHECRNDDCPFYENMDIYEDLERRSKDPNIIAKYNASQQQRKDDGRRSWVSPRHQRIRSVRQVVPTPQRSSASKVFGSSSARDVALRSLSGLAKTMIKAENACMLAQQDLQDIRYQASDSIQSSLETTPRLIKSIAMVKSAQELSRKAADLIEEARRTMLGEMDGVRPL